MKDKKLWNFSRHLILSACITGISYLCEILVIKVLGIKMLLNQFDFPAYIKNDNSAASIGIIGGADGPTVIYLNGAIEPYIVLIPQILLFLLLLLLYKPVKHCFKKIFLEENGCEESDKENKR